METLGRIICIILIILFVLIIVHLVGWLMAKGLIWVMFELFNINWYNGWK